VRKLRIGVDLDGVVFRTLDRVLEIYNEHKGSSYQADDIRSWDSHHWMDGDEYVYEIFNDPEIYRDLPLAPGAREVLTRLDSRHEVFLVSDTPAHCLVPRMEQLRRVFPPDRVRFMGERQIFIGKFKEHILLDVLLDDKPANIVRFQQAGHGTAVVYDWLLNRELTGYPRVRDWYEFEKMIETMEQA